MKCQRGAGQSHLTIEDDSGRSHIPAQIPAHQQATLRVKLDTRTLDGPYEGVVMLSFNDPEVAEAHLTVTGRVVLPIETAAAIFVAAERGEKKQVSVAIVNHAPEPVQIEAPRHSSERFTTALETIEQGRRFRLTLVMNPEGPAGKNIGRVLNHSPSPDLGLFGCQIRQPLAKSVIASLATIPPHLSELLKSCVFLHDLQTSAFPGRRPCNCVTGARFCQRRSCLRDEPNSSRGEGIPLASILRHRPFPDTQLVGTPN